MFWIKLLRMEIGRGYKHKHRIVLELKYKKYMNATIRLTAKQFVIHTFLYCSVCFLGLVFMNLICSSNRIRNSDSINISKTKLNLVQRLTLNMKFITAKKKNYRMGL